MGQPSACHFLPTISFETLVDGGASAGGAATTTVLIGRGTEVGCWVGTTVGVGGAVVACGASVGVAAVGAVAVGLDRTIVVGIEGGGGVVVGGTIAIVGVALVTGPLAIAVIS